MQHEATTTQTQLLINDLAAARRSLLLTQRFAIPVSGAEVRSSGVQDATRRAGLREEIAGGANHLLDAAVGLLIEAENYPVPQVAERLYDQIRTLIHNAGILEAALLRMAASANGSRGAHAYREAVAA